MSLFTGLLRIATVMVAEKAKLIRIMAANFTRLFEEYPDLSEVIADIVSQIT